MTKIKMLNDRIIFDGHADSRQECETITLMCDNLSKSKDFKTIRYESGYAEFEKVGKTEELKFVPGPPPGEPTFMTVNFDSHVIKVEATNEFADTYTWTTSGQGLNVVGNGGTTYYATVTLEDGYEIANVTSTDSNYNLLTFSGKEISFRTGSSGMGSGFTITTKAAAPKQTIDVSTLSGWANLATGNHQITVKTKASGYVDSAASNAVTVSKAAVVSAGKLYFSFATLHDDTGGTGTVTVNDVEVSSGHQLSFGDVIKILPKNNGDTSSYTINGQSVYGLTDGSFVVNWTEGGDITYSEVGFGPGGVTATTVNYLNPTT